MKTEKASQLCVFMKHPIINFGSIECKTQKTGSKVVKIKKLNR